MEVCGLALALTGILGLGCDILIIGARGAIGADGAGGGGGGGGGAIGAIGAGRDLGF